MQDPKIWKTLVLPSTFVLYITSNTKVGGGRIGPCATSRSFQDQQYCQLIPLLKIRWVYIECQIDIVNLLCTIEKGSTLAISLSIN
jgi:hypothetical protein